MTIPDEQDTSKINEYRQSSIVTLSEREESLGSSVLSQWQIGLLDDSGGSGVSVGYLRYGLDRDSLGDHAVISRGSDHKNPTIHWLQFGRSMSLRRAHQCPADAKHFTWYNDL